MAVSETKRNLRVLCSYHFVAFIPWGIFFPYLPLYFQRCGRGDAEIGSLLALPPLLMILSPPIWGAAADRLGDKKRVLLITLGVSALVFPLFWFGRSFAAAMAVMAAFALFFVPSEPLANAITMENLPRAGGDYGKIRLWGSLGFIFPLLFMGLALGPTTGAGADVGSMAPMFVLYAAFGLLVLAWATRLPSAHEVRTGGLDWRALRVLARGQFAIFALCALVWRVGTLGLFIFFSIYLDRLGMGDNLKGYFWAIGVISEVVVMYFAGRIMARTSIKWLFAISLVASAVRLFAFSFPLSFAAIAAVAPLQGIAFAAFHIPAVTYVNQTVPPHLRASGQSLLVAFVWGVGGVIGAQLSGAIADEIGVFGLFRVMSYVVLAALVVFVALFRPQKPAAPEDTSDAVPS